MYWTKEKKTEVLEWDTMSCVFYIFSLMTRSRGGSRYTIHYSLALQSKHGEELRVVGSAKTGDLNDMTRFLLVRDPTMSRPSELRTGSQPFAAGKPLVKHPGLSPEVMSLSAPAASE